MIKLGPVPFASTIIPRMGLWRRVFGEKVPKLQRGGHLNCPARLEVGDLVEVKSVKEIMATLDRNWKLKGLMFMPEMVRFAGRRFRVHKAVRKIMMEATGELRTVRTPTVLLKEVFCDGAAHGNCDRSCYCFWREEWLRKV
jgi:hypothetical protein